METIMRDWQLMFKMALEAILKDISSTTEVRAFYDNLGSAFIWVVH